MKPYYEQDGITIYHGDMLDVLPTLASVDLVVTDPPYFQPATHYVPVRGEKPVRSFGDTSVLLHAFKAWATDIDRVLSVSGTIYMFCDGQSYPIIFNSFYSLGKVRPLIWDKMTSFNGYTWRHQHELIAWIERPDAERIATGDGDILRYRAIPVDNRIHPAEKPIAIAQSMISKHGAELTLDPFMGSGSTLMAAKDLGRGAIGVEIEERYCEIAAKRLSQGVFDLGAAS